MKRESTEKREIGRGKEENASEKKRGKGCCLKPRFIINNFSRISMDINPFNSLTFYASPTLLSYRFPSYRTLRESSLSTILIKSMMRKLHFMFINNNK